MEITRHARRLLRFQYLAFVALFLCAVLLLGWLSTRHHLQWDWTAGARNTLSAASRDLLTSLQGPVSVTAFARENDALRQHIREVIGRYQRVKPDLSLNFVNPDTVPERVRELNITMDGSLLLEYQGRSEVLAALREQEITNALYRMARQGERWLIFVSGHGERSPNGQANHDLGDLGHQLAVKGVRAQAVNLAKTAAIPDNTAALVIAGPQTDLLPGEVDLIRDWLDRGGNLLWLGDPGPLHGLRPIAEYLNVRFLPGRIVDATTQLFGIDNPAMALVTDYPPHPITRDLQATTLFPEAAALEAETEGSAWSASSLLETLPRSWTETGPITGEVRYDEGSGERPGPLTIAYALTRPHDKAPATAGAADGTEGEQRVVVTGDGDFLSNAFLGNGANLDLGLSMVNWLVGDEQLVAVPAKTAPDLTLELSTAASITLVVLFLLLLPAGLLAVGVVVWVKRRRR